MTDLGDSNLTDDIIAPLSIMEKMFSRMNSIKDPIIYNTILIEKISMIIDICVAKLIKDGMDPKLKLRVEKLSKLIQDRLKNLLKLMDQNDRKLNKINRKKKKVNNKKWKKKVNNKAKKKVKKQKKKVKKQEKKGKEKKKEKLISVQPEQKEESEVKREGQSNLPIMNSVDLLPKEEKIPGHDLEEQSDQMI